LILSGANKLVKSIKQYELSDTGKDLMAKYLDNKYAQNDEVVNVHDAQTDYINKR